ncbi:pre-peptidase C-terminal domain-containing protein [Pseudoalteromonas aurantia]|uniref:Phosphohydrolase n=1 Tax=Pseudoalteromonas aurantia 208 TaxID=1314867 RepID=A0ABR9E974_9GAMM|nr:pre-peptidase C-terminal domain-containing protein [Pseudoalteromonas aurantia]MBE0367521.1 hypothetical protein [Pseudoalteromonas aurantia 208]
MNRSILALMIGLTLASSSVHAGSQYHRLVWDANPSQQATIGFSPTSGSNHYVKYGVSTNEQTWQNKSVLASHTFASSLQSQFVTLTGLPENSNVYYRVCDSEGCAERLWFKTAPTTSSGFTVVAGGDTRTGWTNRRKGNELIAKIRPLFIMHGGDYTNANSSSEMKEYLKDWQLTFSTDQIDGISYKRIYPFVATHGNHEDDNYKTLCQVFGIDFNQDGSCTSSDTYGAFNVSQLLRVYTLNSQYKNSGWSSYATAMNNWLTQDLTARGSSAKWRVAQYHKPMYPHYSGKSDNTILHTWWAQNFYDKKMNLVVESDTHINKITQALKPSGNNFVKTTTGGTIYVGEGSWGAPARSANDPKSWTIDLASIQQFKVMSVTSSNLTVRTAQFDSTASTLSKAQRDADPLALPANINWWYASGLGEDLVLKQSASGLSIIDNMTDPVDPPTAETPLTNNTPLNGLNGNKGGQAYYVLDVPTGVKTLSFKTSGGTGDADMYVKFANKPTSTSYDCRPYKSGNNETCEISSIQAGKYYVMLSGYAPYANVTLVANYDSSTTPPDNGGSQQWPNLGADKGQWIYKTLTLPTGVTTLTVDSAAGSGDADLYVRFGSKPTTSSYDCRPYKEGNTESCVLSNPQAGEWHIALRAYSTFSGVNVAANY